jgi:hypothetical protein
LVDSGVASCPSLVSLRSDVAAKMALESFPLFLSPRMNQVALRRANRRFFFFVVIAIVVVLGFVLVLPRQSLVSDSLCVIIQSFSLLRLRLMSLVAPGL